MIELHNVTKQYGETVVVDKISLAVSEGEPGMVFKDGRPFFVLGLKGLNLKKLKLPLRS